MRDSLRAVREAADKTLCGLEADVDFINRQYKTVRTGLVASKRMPLSDEDTIQYKKKHLLGITSHYQSNSVALIASVVDLVHTLELRGTDTLAMQDRVQAYEADPEVKKRKLTYTRKEDGCRCHAGQCRKGMPGGGCKCSRSGKPCDAACHCAGCANPYNPREDNVAMDDETSE